MKRAILLAVLLGGCDFTYYYPCQCAGIQMLRSCEEAKVWSAENGGELCRCLPVSDQPPMCPEGYEPVGPQ